MHASCHLIQLYVRCHTRIFNVFSALFFSLLLHSVYVCTGRDIIPFHVCMEQDTIRDLPSRDCDAATPQAGVAWPCCRWPPLPHRPLLRLMIRARIGKIGNIPQRFAVGSTRFFAVFFFVFTFVFMPIFVLAFITAQTAAATALSPKVEFLAIIRFRAFSASILLTMCRSARSLLCE